MTQSEERIIGTHNYTDPVRRMQVRETETYYYSYYRGSFHYFSCSGCKAAFEKPPETVLKNSLTDEYDKNTS